MSTLGERKTTTVKIGEHDLVFETGKIAKQANGSVVVRMGDTIVFSSACMEKKPSTEIDFLPLQVHYQEKFSSAGKTLSGFIKREGRPSEKEVLTSRLIDRPLRPSFPDGYYNETQVLTYVWSYDSEHQPDVLGICASSAALLISDIPFYNPVAGVRVGLVNGSFVINPSASKAQESKLDLIIAGTEQAILMIEGYCDFLTEEQVIEAIETGHRAIQQICQAMRAWQKEVGKDKKEDLLRPQPKEIEAEILANFKNDLLTALTTKGKAEANAALEEVCSRVTAHFYPEENEETPRFSEVEFKIGLKSAKSAVLRELVLNENKRHDHRTTTDIRPIDVEIATLPRAHGSALFTRGETQAMAVCTLGSTSMAQRYEDLEGEGAHQFYLQYSFPPFSVGEVGRSGPPGRREVGHGKLAEKALKYILPGEDKNFPYIIRLESNITESNGSSSMASVCGGCLALMDAGVPIKKPVAGIAMGLILEKDRYAILSDITGTEDALGDMDFKITGDAQGITAFQMDIKVEGITHEIMAAALAQAKEGRVHILERMTEICPKARDAMSKYAPRIISLHIKPSKIGTVIGPGGKQIREIIEKSGAEVEIDNDGLVRISSSNAESVEKARRMIEGLVAEIEIGAVYTGPIKSVVPFGVFIEVLPGQEGLCHISEISHERINDITQAVKEGDEMTVKVLDINERGQIKLSRKALLAKAERPAG